MGATVLVILRAIGNGGSSLTGLEAIPNTVHAFREPQGINGRRVLTAVACILGFLLVGVSWLAHATHATPYRDEYPSVLSEIARAVFGNGLIGIVLYLLVQAATATILFAGANTGFKGFPALTSFFTKDQSLQQPGTKRGTQLLLSNGLLALLSVALLLLAGGSIYVLLPLYAIVVFISFAMAGYSMTAHHLRHRGRGWPLGLLVNLTAGIVSSLMVGIFVVLKFTEGAWLVVFVFLILVPVLILLNGRTGKLRA